MADNFEKLTVRARRVLSLAQEEARWLNHSSIGTEHLLFGLVRDTECWAARDLRSLGVRLTDVRGALKRMGSRRHPAGCDEIELSHDAKLMLEHAAGEMQRLDDFCLGPEHLLLGLLDEPQCGGAVLLMTLGVDLEQLRQRIMVGVNHHASAVAPVNPHPSLGDLLRVIPIKETQTQARLTVTLRLLAVYAHGVVIHTRFVPEEPLPISPPIKFKWPHPKLRAKDDLGGTYAGSICGLT
ncbi:Clp protease N-terminal domain-containing protein, partial [Nitrolancea hollandica]|uniref:Clp protease N-terminal domain-containing protein n=1 Tax=Nitrolancea hollandica TaxID=1206749 RepID=UPI0006867296